jgi:hypothetical protein
MTDAAPAAPERPPKTSFSPAWFAAALLVMGVLRGGVEIYGALCYHFDQQVAMGVGYATFTPFCYFLTSLFIGWKSDGRSYFEPALAALMISAPTTLLVVVFRAHAPEASFCCGCDAILEFFVAFIGAWLGERLQGR